MADADADAHNQRIIEQFTRWARPFADNPIHSHAEGMTRLINACGPLEGAHVLDVACGPGLVACALSPKAAHVTGVDLTPAMIAQADRRRTQLGLNNMDWRIGDATALPFTDRRFDVVIARYSFHHLMRPDAALLEMKRVCRPGGRIVVVDATPRADAQHAYDEMETLRDPSHATALTLAQLRALGAQANLEEVVVEGFRLESDLRGICEAAVLPAMEAMLDADIEAGRDRLGVQAWRAPDGVRFYFPISIVSWAR
jgi:ubiquinone/menaquinone biosynthesis C-methylase UbiE